jgi:hypothetical protein
LKLDAATEHDPSSPSSSWIDNREGTRIATGSGNASVSGDVPKVETRWHCAQGCRCGGTRAKLPDRNARPTTHDARQRLVWAAAFWDAWQRAATAALAIANVPDIPPEWEKAGHCQQHLPHSKRSVQRRDERRSVAVGVERPASRRPSG